MPQTTQSTLEGRAAPNWAGRAFLLALVTAAAAFLPFVIVDGGYFIYYGDFNVQQIPFYRLAHEAVRSGDIWWSWRTDLGANFIGSYSFYLLFSPFFWLTLAFPAAALPFLMAPLLVLKTACAALTAYMYLARFVRERAYAVLGSLLYAFSGWMMYNVFFNHFHEAAVFFPLLLLGVEKLVKDDRRGLFALAVAVNAIVNYWFFAGEAVFCVLYVFVRMTDKDFGMSLRKFARLAFEAALGVGLAAAAILPSVMAITGNPRMGAETIVNGWGAWLYWNEQRLPAILQSVILPPDLPARPNFFPAHEAKWASLSAWLPMLGASGVFAYFIQRKADWLKKLLALSLLFALVPGLNSLFVLLNHSYYARWFFMPVLLMALASSRAVEDCIRFSPSYSRALKWQFGLVLAFALVCGVTPTYAEGLLTYGLAEDLPLLWMYVAAAFAGAALTGFIVLNLRRKRYFKNLLLGAVACYAALFMIFYMGSGKMIFERSTFMIDAAINGSVALPEGPFARADAFKAQDNLLMFWGLPNIQAFHSIVPASIMEFYPAVGVTRDVGSRPGPEYPALRPLLSVRWLFVAEDEEEQEPMSGYAFHGGQMGFNVYENQNYIPMGFSYDETVAPESLKSLPEKYRAHALLKAVALDEKAAARHADILTRADITADIDYSSRALAADSAERRALAADSFSPDARGFSAVTSYDKPRLVFFSVPYDAGWRATVNGSPAYIERANLGFMAVRVPSGRAEIRFDYYTPGLYGGAIISLAALGVYLAYLAAVLLLARRAAEKGELA